MREPLYVEASWVVVGESPGRTSTNTVEVLVSWSWPRRERLVGAPTIPTSAAVASRGCEATTVAKDRSARKMKNAFHTN